MWGVWEGWGRGGDTGTEIWGGGGGGLRYVETLDIHLLSLTFSDQVKRSDQYHYSSHHYYWYTI